MSVLVPTNYECILVAIFCVFLFTENCALLFTDYNNALNDYITNRNKQGKMTIGGIIIPKDGSWRYRKNKIEKGYDVSGWEVFNPVFVAN